MHLPPAPAVMGVITMAPELAGNNSPQKSLEQALATGEQMLKEGASLLGVTAESLRPDSPKITVQQELERIIPLIELLSKRLAIPLVVETSNPEVMERAAQAGAKMIYDVLSLTKPGALNMAVKLGLPVCLMHMQADPVTMRMEPVNQDIVTRVYQYLEQRVAACTEAGMDSKKISIDPGFGYARGLQANINILRSLELFKKLQLPVAVSFINNSVVGQILDVSVEQREFGSVSAAVIAIGKGADIIRTTNVQAMFDAIKVFTAVAGR